MNLENLLESLKAKGVNLWIENNNLQLSAPRNNLTEVDLSKLRQHKQGILQLLREGRYISGTCPLSRGQESLYFIHKLAPESFAYNIGFALRIRSELDTKAMQSALQALIERHAGLRTLFAVDAGNRLVQNIYGYRDICFKKVDASGCKLQDEVKTAYEQPFDLEKGHLLRVHLFTCSGDDHVLLFTIHHIVLDGWSMWMLLSELGKLYSAKKTGSKADLKTIKATYADFVEWQSEMLAGPEGEELWNYWHRQLGGELAALNLPTDRPRPSMQTFNGATYTFELNEELNTRLEDLARVEKVTLFMLLLAAYQILLHRYTSQEDIMVGSPTAGRSQKRFAGISGYFVNPVVMRADLSNDPVFKDFLSQVKETALGAMEHQNYPFIDLVNKLKIERDPSLSPIVQADFVLQRPQEFGELREIVIGKRVKWGGLDIEFFDLGQEEGQNDLQLEMLSTGKTCFAKFKYNTDLFNPDTIERMAGHFQALLEGIVSDPDRKISELPILTEAEKHRILMEWNDTQTYYPRDKCIHHLFEEQVKKTPDAVAAVFPWEHIGDQQFTYSELNRKANQLAHYLRNLGVKPETLVGICVERSPEMITGLLGILKAGGAYVPLDPEYPKERLAFMLEDTRAPVLLTQSKIVDSLPEHQAELVCLDTDREIIGRESGENPVSEVNPDNICYAIYTSGSTGKPRGSLNIHRALSNRLTWMPNACQLTADARILQKTPFSFDASVWEFFVPLLTGARLVFAKPGGHKDMAYLITLIEEHKITALDFVPSVLHVFLEDKNIEACTSIRQVICGGEALTLQLQKKFFSRLNAELYNFYGPTEAAIDVSCWQCKKDSDLETVPIGFPIANTQLYILNKSLMPVPVGVPGEIHIGGAGLAIGYLNRPELTAEKFIPNPFSHDSDSRLYKTGDLGRYLSDGSIEFIGRIDNQVKIRGFRIELGEIEAVLGRHTEVKEAVVLAREDRPGDRHLTAYIVPEQDRAPGGGDLRSFLKRKLPDYMVPSAFVILNKLPLTPSGKVNLKALPASDPDLMREHEFVAPRNETEEMIADIWKKVLHLEKVSIHDNFFEIGGESLLTVSLVSQIRQQSGISLPVAKIFEFPTVERLAQLVHR